MRNPLWRRYTGLEELVGTRMPCWMGIAYRRFDRDEVLLVAIPLNMVVKWWVVFVEGCRRHNPGYWERREREAYCKGREIGFRAALKNPKKRLFPN